MTELGQLLPLPWTDGSDCSAPFCSLMGQGGGGACFRWWSGIEVMVMRESQAAIIDVDDGALVAGLRPSERAW